LKKPGERKIARLGFSNVKHCSSETLYGKYVSPLAGHRNIAGLHSRNILFSYILGFLAIFFHRSTMKWDFGT